MEAEYDELMAMTPVSRTLYFAREDEAAQRAYLQRLISQRKLDKSVSLGEIREQREFMQWQKKRVNQATENVRRKHSSREDSLT